MNSFGLSKLKIEKDKSGNYWIAEFSEKSANCSIQQTREDTFKVMGEIASSLVALDCSDWKLKNDIYLAFIGLLGRWVHCWRAPMKDMAIKAIECDEFGVEFSPERSKVCVGNIRVIESMQNTLSLVTNDAFRKALGGRYEQLPEKDIEELKHLLYELSSAVIRAHEMDAKAENE